MSTGNTGHREHLKASPPYGFPVIQAISCTFALMIHDPSFKRLSAPEENYPSRTFRFLHKPDFWTNRQFSSLTLQPECAKSFYKVLGKLLPMWGAKSSYWVSISSISGRNFSGFSDPRLWITEDNLSTNHGKFLLCFRDLKARNQLDNSILQ